MVNRFPCGELKMPVLATIFVQSKVWAFSFKYDVSFTENDKGEIFPNGCYEGAEWKYHTDTRFGQHTAQQTSKNGYSLTIGAVAKLKITYKYGDSKKIEYENYYKGGSHLGTEDSAQRLNSWTSFRLEHFKEIPHSDESAEFFCNLMYGIAKISKMIQDSTFDQENLLKLIASGGGLLLSRGEKQ